MSYCRALAQGGAVLNRDGNYFDEDGCDGFNDATRDINDNYKIHILHTPRLESPVEITHALIDLQNIVFAQDKRATRPPARDAVDKAVNKAIGALKTKNLLQRLYEKSNDANL